jgi:hypothetical protein
MKLLREYIRGLLEQERGSKGNLVVVDIQPEYESNTSFDIGDMLRTAAEDYSRVLFLFNGEDTLGMVSESALKNFYFEKLDYDEEVFDNLLSKSEFFDKGYGFFRDVMDSSVCYDRNQVVKIVKYMIGKDIQDIRDLEEEDIKAIGVNELLFDDLEDYGFWVPDLSDELPNWSGSDLAGGARNECMAEVEILGAAQGLSFNHVDQFIYEGDNRYTESLTEDAMGFVHDLAAADSEFGEEGVDFFGGDPGKGGGKAIKRAFNANADHKWLATLDTVHWSGDFYAMEGLKGKSKDELSATMTLPGEDFDWPLDYGLWIKGRITLASNNQDNLYTGFHTDFGAGKEGTEEEVAHRDKSSGRNKRPLVSKDYSRYGGLKRGNEYAEMVAKKIPYLLDQSMWAPAGNNNEALVDNWRPVGIILTRGDEINAISGLDYIEGTKEDIEEFAIGVTKQILLTALAFGVPVYDTERDMLWSPK